jgi:hypothetical protein
LVYNAIHFNKEKKQVAAYIKAIENMADRKQEEMVIRRSSWIYIPEGYFEFDPTI